MPKKRKKDSADKAIIDAGLVLGNPNSTREAKIRQDAKFDFSAPAFNDPARLIEFRNLLGIGQMELADAAQVSQTLISAIERSEKKFTEPSRSKIWNTIFWLMEEKAKREAASNPPLPTGEPGYWQAMSNVTSLLGLNKTPLEYKTEECELLRRELDAYKKEMQFTRQLLDMNLVDRCIELEKQLADARLQLADYGRLFNLKGSTVAGDELQEQIESRQKAKGPEK